MRHLTIYQSHLLALQPGLANLSHAYLLVSDTFDSTALSIKNLSKVAEDQIPIYRPSTPRPGPKSYGMSLQRKRSRKR